MSSVAPREMCELLSQGTRPGYPAPCTGQTDGLGEGTGAPFPVVTKQLPSDYQRFFLELGTYTSISPCKHSRDKKGVPGYMQQPAWQVCLLSV